MTITGNHSKLIHSSKIASENCDCRVADGDCRGQRHTDRPPRTTFTEEGPAWRDHVTTSEWIDRRRPLADIRKHKSLYHQHKLTTKQFRRQLYGLSGSFFLQKHTQKFDFLSTWRKLQPDFSWHAHLKNRPTEKMVNVSMEYQRQDRQIVSQHLQLGYSLLEIMFAYE